MKPTSPATMIELELTEALAPPLPSAPTIREMKKGAAIGSTNVADIQITDAANAAAIPTRALLR
jgi:hypothetical protein